MLSALIRRLFGSANASVLPYAVGVIGVSASLIADPAFIVIPPLAAMVFKAAGRHPVAGLLGGFASVGAGYATSILPGSLDALFAGITNSVMEALPSLEANEVTVMSNYWFNIASASILGFIAGLIIDKVLEPRLNKLEVSTEMVEGDDGMSVDANGKETPQDRPEGVRVISEATAKTLTEMLIGVTQEGGTAESASINGYLVAGKTGTTEILTDDSTVASFVGFLPAR